MTWHNLHETMKDDSEWRYYYKDQIEKATEVATRVPLVHVTHRKGRTPFHERFKDDPAVLPTSEDETYCSPATRHAEDVLGLGRSLYFYAGRAHPEFGDVALMFAPTCERAHTGSVTPFDTGGWVADPPRCLLYTLRDRELIERVAYARNATVDLAEWRVVFASYLAAYFRPLREYWTGKPWKRDPVDLFLGTQNDMRAWTVEVRFTEPLLLNLVTVWCSSEGFREELRRAIKAGHASGYASRVKRFLRDSIVLAPSGSPLFCDIANEWIIREVGL